MKTVVEKSRKRRPSKAVANVVAQQKSYGQGAFEFVDNRNDTKKLNRFKMDIANYDKGNVLQKKTRNFNSIQLVRGRREERQPRDRHNIPHPFMDLKGWYYTLIKERIDNLFLTHAGLPGHLVQVQQEINKLVNEIDNGNFVKRGTLQEALEAARQVRSAIWQRAKEATFDFNKILIYWEGNKVQALECQNGQFNGNK